MVSTCKGFTLIEMLVALVIFSSLMLILMSGYMQGLSLWHRAEKKAAIWQVYQNRVSWMQRLTEQLVAADYRQSFNQSAPFFKGNVTGFEAITSAPILSPAGRPVHVEFRLRAAVAGSLQLLYREGVKGKPPGKEDGLRQSSWVVLLDHIDQAFFRYYRLPSKLGSADLLGVSVLPAGWVDSAVRLPGRVELNFNDVNGAVHRWRFHCQTSSSARLLLNALDGG